MVFGWLAQCNILHPRSEGRDDQLQQGKDSQVFGEHFYHLCLKRKALGLPIGRRPIDRDQPHSISDELDSHILNLVLGKGLT